MGAQMAEAARTAKTRVTSRKEQARAAATATKHPTTGRVAPAHDPAMSPPLPVEGQTRKEATAARNEWVLERFAQPRCASVTWLAARCLVTRGTILSILREARHAKDPRAERTEEQEAFATARDKSEEILRAYRGGVMVPTIASRFTTNNELGRGAVRAVIMEALKSGDSSLGLTLGSEQPGDSQIADG